MKLRELQKAFLDSLSGNDNQNLLATLCESDAISANRRIAVHRSNMRFSLSSTLRQIYPVCHRILGKDYFEQVVQAYIGHYPSDHSDLNYYGQHLPEFFAELLTVRDELIDFAYLPDLAKLESYLHTVYYAADNPPFDFGAFAQVVTQQDSKEIWFLLPASLKLLTSVYPLFAIWRANKNKEMATEVASCEDNQYLCIYRRDDKPTVELISQLRYDLLWMVSRGASLERLAEQFDTLDNELPSLIKNGWLCGFTASSPKPGP